MQKWLVLLLVGDYVVHQETVTAPAGMQAALILFRTMDRKWLDAMTGYVVYPWGVVNG